MINTELRQVFVGPPTEVRLVRENHGLLHALTLSQLTVGLTNRRITEKFALEWGEAEFLIQSLELSHSPVAMGFNRVATCSLSSVRSVL